MAKSPCVSSQTSTPAATEAVAQGSERFHDPGPRGLKVRPRLHPVPEDAHCRPSPRRAAASSPARSRVRRPLVGAGPPGPGEWKTRARVDAGDREARVGEPGPRRPQALELRGAPVRAHSASSPSRKRSSTPSKPSREAGLVEHPAERPGRAPQRREGEPAVPPRMSGREGDHARSRSSIAAG